MSIEYGVELLGRTDARDSFKWKVLLEGIPMVSLDVFIAW